MVRENRIKIHRQTLTGVGGLDYKTSSDTIDGEIEKVTVIGAGVIHELDITPTAYSGLSSAGFQFLNIAATGNGTYYPRVTLESNDGTDAAAGDNKWGKYVVRSKVDYNASVLATGSTVTVRVYYT